MINVGTLNDNVLQYRVFQLKSEMFQLKSETFQLKSECGNQNQII